MCRRNQLLGCCAGAFGLGLLIGHCIASGLIAIGLGIGLILIGLSILRQK